MKEYDIKDYEISIGGHKLDFNSVIDIDRKADAKPADYQGKIEMKLLNSNPHQAIQQLINPPKEQADDVRDCLMVYQVFRWEIMKVRFKRDNPAQQAQELAEKISRYFGLEKCPIRIDRFEIDQDGAIALDVALLI